MNQKRNTGAAFTTEEVKQRILSRVGNTDLPVTISSSSFNHSSPSTISSTNNTTTTSTNSTKKPFQSRFLGIIYTYIYFFILLLTASF